MRLTFSGCTSGWVASTLDAMGNDGRQQGSGIDGGGDGVIGEVGHRVEGWW